MAVRCARSSSPPSYLVFGVMFVLSSFVIVGIPVVLLSCYRVCVRFQRAFGLAAPDKTRAELSAAEPDAALCESTAERADIELQKPCPLTLQTESGLYSTVKASASTWT